MTVATDANGTEQFAKFTGNRHADMIQFYQGAAYVVTWDTTTNAYDAWSIRTMGCTGNELIADVDGDGKADLIQLNSNGTAYVALFNGTTFGAWQAWGNSPSDSRHQNSGRTCPNELIRFVARVVCPVLTFVIHAARSRRRVIE
jgi:hypothetical protein